MTSMSFGNANSGLQVGINQGPIYLPPAQPELERIQQHLHNAEYRRCRDSLQATDPHDDKARIEEEKGGLLRDLYSWVLDHIDFQKWRDTNCGQLLWIKGDPGKGKTMLLCGIIDELYNTVMHDTNISFFFCQAANIRVNNAAAVLRGLINMLVKQQPTLITHIRDGSFGDENAWFALCRAFTNILKDPHLRSTYLIIDALDECTTDLSRLLRLLVKQSSAYSHVKWLVSSRNLPSIENGLNGLGQIKLLLELNEDTPSAAIDSFIQHKINILAETNNYSLEIRDVLQHYLTSNADGTFLWVALVCKELTDVKTRHVQARLKNFPPGLDELYGRMLNQISESDDSNLCKSLLSITATVFRPITLDELTSCIDLPEDIEDDLPEIIGLCGSFLTLRGRTISWVHQSAKEFLLREAFDGIFPDGVEKVHYSIFSKSLRAMSRTLQRDIYNLVHPGYSIEKVNKPEPDPLATIGYTSVYWIDHLNGCSSSKNATEDLQDSGAVSNFFTNDFLYWLEALSLSRSLSKGVASLLKLQSMLKVTANPELLDSVLDACRFIRFHKVAIENHPLQVYVSGLVFSPTESITRIQFETQEPAWIIRKPTMEDGWSSCLQTLEGHRGSVNSVTFSPGSKLLASASNDLTARLWDAGSGQCLQTLEGHGDSVHSVAFSHDSKHVASASYDRTIKVWDASSGECLQTLEGHGGSVNSVTFSYDSKFLASASIDETVKLWDSSSGNCLQTLKGHSGFVSSVAFSHDSKLLISGSLDRTVKVWDASSGNCLQTLEGHSRRVISVAVSHDSRLLASGSLDRTVKVWDPSSGECLWTVEAHSSMVTSVVFSLDSRLLASGSLDKAVKLWDTSSGKCFRIIEGHSSVSSVAFSHDSKVIASASYDSNVKFWDAESNKCPQALKSHSDSVNLVVFSHDFEFVASASYDRSVKVWNARSGQCLHTLLGHSDSVNSVIFSYDSKLVASTSHDQTVKVWDTSSGQCLQTFAGYRGGFGLVIFSYDSKLVATASYDYSARLWDTSSWKCTQTLKGHNGPVRSVTFSDDCMLLASASSDATVRLWDTSSGKCLRILEGHGGPVSSVAFSRDFRLLASGSFDESVKVWDTSSGKCLWTLRAHKGLLGSVTFSHDSRLLAAASINPISENGINVWDLTTGNCLQTFLVERGVTVKSFDITNSYLETDNGTICLFSASNIRLRIVDPRVQRLKGYSISSDGIWITWNSENLLWLPPEYRACTFAVSLSAICLGCPSGRVLLFILDPPNL